MILVTAGKTINPSPSSWLRRRPNGCTFWSMEFGRNVPEQTAALMNAAVVLALNYGAQKNRGGIAQLAPVFRLFQPSSLPPGIESELPEEIRAVLRANSTKSVAD